MTSSVSASDSEGGGAPLYSTVGSRQESSPSSSDTEKMSNQNYYQALVPYVEGGSSTPGSHLRGSSTPGSHHTGSHHSHVSAGVAPANTTPAMMTEDIRNACVRAQQLIMRLQQSTNNQAGVDSRTRDFWFNQLKEVAQCFITAQTAAVRFEQMTTTEHARLNASLTAATNERDMSASQLESASQEIKMLESRVADLQRKYKAVTSRKAKETGSPEESEKRNGDFRSTAVAKRCSSWIAEQEMSDADNNVLDDATKENWHSNQRVSLGSPAVRKSNADQEARSALMPAAIYTPPQKRDAVSSLAEQVAMLDVNMPPPGSTFKPPITPLAQRVYSRVDAHKSYGHLTGEHTTQWPNRSFTAAPQFAPFGGPSGSRGSVDGEEGGEGPSSPIRSRSRGDTAVSVESWSSLAPSASASNVMKSKQLPVTTDSAFINKPLSPGTSGEIAGADVTWNNEFYRIFTMVLGWVRLNCNSVDYRVTAGLAVNTPQLWEFISQITYPHSPKDAQSHAVFMLNNTELRPFLIARLLIQYIAQTVWNPRSWDDLDGDLCQTMNYIREQLVRADGYGSGVSAEQRRSLVEQRARAVQSFMRSPAWPKARSQIMGRALTRYKDIVSPFLNTQTDRHTASHDLSVLCEKTLRVAAQINASPLTFNFSFTECGARYNDGSHVAINSHMSPMQLQSQHWRLMMSVSPGITYHNDTVDGLDHRCISKSNVLVMH